MTSSDQEPTFAVSGEPDESGAFVLAIDGEVDLFTAPQVKRVTRDAIAAGHRRFVLDLSNTTFLDSTGLGVIIGLARSVRPAGDVTIVNVDDAIGKTLQVTGLDAIFSVRQSRAEALSALRESTPS